MVIKENVFGSQSSNMSDKSIKCVSDIFVPLEGVSSNPYTILIEGAPGIGKTILSKEIALQWADKLILQSQQLLFLLFLRNPHIKSITSVTQLVNHFCESSALSGKITDWLIETDGKYLTTVLDGYDGVTRDNQSHLLSDIINCNKLTQCGLVISSRPATSSHLHNIVVSGVEILGFAREDQHSFIQDALQKQSSEIKSCKDFLWFIQLLVLFAMFH